MKRKLVLSKGEREANEEIFVVAPIVFFEYQYSFNVT